MVKKEDGMKEDELRTNVIANVSSKLRSRRRRPPFISHIQDKRCILMQHAAGQERTALTVTRKPCYRKDDRAMRHI